MRFACDGDDLWAAVSTAAQVSPKSDPRQSLTDVWISVRGEEASVLGSSGSTSIRTTCPVTDVEAGGVGLPAAKFTQMCRGFRGLLTLRLTPKDVLVLESVGGGSTAKIPGIRSGDNPPEFGLPLGYVLPKFAETPASSLRGALSCVAFASSAEGHRRFSLQGVLFHVVDGKLRLVATDGKCLALSRVEPCEALPVRVLVPSSTVGFLDKVLKGHDGPVQLGADETSFSVALPGVTMRSSITTENFPPYEAHVSRNLIQDVRCDTRELVAALKRLDSVIGDEDDCALLELRPGWVCVSWKGRAGEGIEFIHAEHDVSRLVGISARRLASGLSVFSGSEMRMGFVDDAGPLFIEDAERRRLCVVMPKALDLVVAESDRVPPQSVASVPGE